MENKLVIGGKYTHFKGHEVKVICEAKHTETGEPFVVYHCNGPHGSEFKGGIYARPKDMFLSEVDREKYPEVTQQFRFNLESEEKMAMATLVSDDNIYLEVKDLVPIERLPEAVKEFIAEFVKSMKILDNGLPASGFIGESGCKITGIFKYGEIGFISYVGTEEEITSGQLIHIFSNVTEEEYEEIKKYAENQLTILDKEETEDAGTEC